MLPKSHQTGRRPTLRHLEQLMDRLLDGVILMDPTGVILSVNPAALAMHGVPDGRTLGDTAEDYARRFTLWTEKRRPLKQREYPFFQVLAGERVSDEVVQVAPAGEHEPRWVHRVRDVVMDVDGGEPDYLAIVLSDVSDRYDAEARFSAMFRANPAPAIIVRQTDLRVAQVNPGFHSLTGFERDELVERSLFGLDLLGGLPDRSAVRREMEAGQVVPQTEAELLTADGSRRLVLFAGQPIDVTGEDSLLLTFADLQPRREAEQSLAASEHHLSAVFEMAPVPMVITDADGRLSAANAAFRHMTGFEDGLLLGNSLEDAGVWRNVEQRTELELAVARRGSVRDGDAHLVSRTSDRIDCLASAEAIQVRGSRCTLWVFQDVTERRRSEAELGDAIGEVLKDASWLSRSILDRLASLRSPSPEAPQADLSAREREILDLICDDLDDPAIARRLEISRNTVRNHVARIYSKIGVNRRSGAVVWGRERGMGSRRS